MRQRLGSDDRVGVVVATTRRNARRDSPDATEDGGGRDEWQLLSDTPDDCRRRVADGRRRDGDRG